VEGYDPYDARLTSGAGPIQVGRDVRAAADVAVALADTPAHVHSTVAAAADSDHFVHGAGGVEGLPVTVLLHF